MASLNEIKVRLQSLDVQSIAAYSLDENRDLIKEAQQDQLKRGERSDGGKIGRYRNPAYASMKSSINPLPGLGNVDLILTGSYKNDIFVDVRSSTIVIDSGDSKAAELFQKYGDPFGLGVKARVKVIDEGLKKTFVDNVKKQLKLL